MTRAIDRAITLRDALAEHVAVKHGFQLLTSERLPGALMIKRVTIDQYFTFELDIRDDLSEAVLDLSFCYFEPAIEKVMYCGFPKPLKERGDHGAPVVGNDVRSMVGARGRSTIIVRPSTKLQAHALQKILGATDSAFAFLADACRNRGTLLSALLDPEKGRRLCMLHDRRVRATVALAVLQRRDRQFVEDIFSSNMELFRNPGFPWWVRAAIWLLTCLPGSSRGAEANWGASQILEFRKCIMSTYFKG